MGIGQIMKLNESILLANSTVVLFTKLDLDDPYMVIKMDRKRWEELGSPQSISIGIHVSSDS